MDLAGRLPLVATLSIPVTGSFISSKQSGRAKRRCEHRPSWLLSLMWHSLAAKTFPACQPRLSSISEAYQTGLKPLGSTALKQRRRDIRSRCSLSSIASHRRK